MSLQEKHVLTEEGKKKLDEELHDLINNVRPSITQEIKEAAAQGDLSENYDYHAAKAKQAEIEAKINQLKEILKNAEIIKKPSLGTVGLGSIVDIEKIRNGKSTFDTYAIVGSLEVDPLNTELKKISNESELGKAMLGKKVGEETEIKAVKPYIIKILNIR